MRRSSSIRLAALVLATGLASSAAACTRAAPDATPEGVVRLWLDRMEASTDDPHAARDAFALLGPAARANLAERSERASRTQGRRVEPYEMLAEGRFGPKFRPKSMSATIQGDTATVQVEGDDPTSERALVQCAREGALWRIEPALPDVAALPRWRDGG